MNLRDLEYLNAINRLGSMARAASFCRVSQSTLSIQLKKLEEALGVKIFERNKKRMLPTPIGKSILEVSSQISAKAEEIIQLAKESSDPNAGELRFGAFPTLAPYWFPKIIPSIKKNFPKIKIQLFEEKTDVLVDKLLRGELDCAALALPVQQKEFNHKSLFKEDFFLAVPATHKLTDKKLKNIPAGAIKNERLLLLEEGHCMRGQALSFCSRQGISESENYRAASLETLRNMVIAGEGITLIPQIAIHKDDKRVRYIEFNSNKPTREIGLFWRKANPRGEFFANLAKVLEE